MVSLSAFVRGLRFAAFVRGLHLPAFVRDQVGGVLSSAAVPRCGLGPLPPPLCRCAEYTADLILRAWRVFCRYRDLILPAWRVVHRYITVSTSTACLPLGQTHPYRCPCAWFGRRSGIKEESAALGRHGGQPRSRPSQAHGRTRQPQPSAESSKQKPTIFRGRKSDLDLCKKHTHDHYDQTP
jgi:hypothetical protein